MGQYFYIVNEDKQEFLHPHKLGSGLKFWEILANRTPTCALGFMLFKSSPAEYDNHAGTHVPYKHLGRWAGDRITIVGDYDDSKLYNKAEESFTDISDEVRDEFNTFIGKENDDLKIKKD